MYIFLVFFFFVQFIRFVEMQFHYRLENGCCVEWMIAVRNLY